jgi:hypothetical protein
VNLPRLSAGSSDTCRDGNRYILFDSFIPRGYVDKKEKEIDLAAFEQIKSSACCVHSSGYDSLNVEMGPKERDTGRGSAFRPAIHILQNIFLVSPKLNYAQLYLPNSQPIKQTLHSLKFGVGKITYCPTYITIAHHHKC